MFSKSLSTCSLVVLMASLALGCRSDADPISPLEPQFAKGGKPGGGSHDKLELVEYYVYYANGEEGTPGQPMVHIVGKGNVASIRFIPVHDYHFNGAFDDDYSEHYEASEFWRPTVDVTLEPDGFFHVDIPWDGSRSADRETGEVLEYFKDFAVTDVDEAGADPFVFGFWYLGGSTSLASFEPQGIVLSGEETSQTSMDARQADSRWHSFAAGEEIYSYATFKGQEASGRVSLTDVSVQNLTCQLVQVTDGKGKNRVTTTYAQVTGDVHVSTGLSGVVTDEDPALWMEWHFVNDSDPDNPDPSRWEYTKRESVIAGGAEVEVDSLFTGVFQESAGPSRFGSWWTMCIPCGTSRSTIRRGTGSCTTRARTPKTLDSARWEAWPARWVTSGPSPSRLPTS